jgi:hypothetical protein
VDPSDIRIDLYWPASSAQHAFDADSVAAAEVRNLYEQVCTPGSSH